MRKLGVLLGVSPQRTAVSSAAYKRVEESLRKKGSGGNAKKRFEETAETVKKSVSRALEWIPPKVGEPVAAKMAPNVAVGCIAGINTVVYALWKVAWKNTRMMDAMEHNWTVSMNNLKCGRWWPLFTSMVSNADFGNLVASLNSLLSCGLPLAQMLGTKKFLAFYVLSGAASSAAIMLREKVSGDGKSGTVVLGSGGVGTAMLMAYGLAFPHTVTMVNGYIRMPIIIECLATAIYDCYNSGNERATGVQHTGHFVAAAFGAICYFFSLRKK